MTKTQFKAYLPYAFLAAVIYSAFVGIFIYYQSYNQSWLLYAGNFLFAAVIGFFLYRYYKRSKYALKILQLVGAGQLTGIMGIVIACVFCLLLLAFLVPGFFMHANTENMLNNPPAQLQQGKNSYTLIIFADAIFGNIAAGSFVAILFPFTLSRNQETD